MEWDRIKKKWAEMTSRVQSPATPGSTPVIADSVRAAGRPDDPVDGRLGSLVLSASDERSAI